MKNALWISALLMLSTLPISIASIPETSLKKAEFSKQAPVPICPDGFAVKLTLEKQECRLGDKIKAIFEIKNISNKPKYYLCENMFQEYLFVIRNMDTREEYHASTSLMIHSGPAIYAELLKPNETFTRNYTLSGAYGLNKTGTYEITYIWPLGEGPDTEDVIHNIDGKISKKKIREDFPDIAGYPKKIVTNTVLLKVIQK